MDCTWLYCHTCCLDNGPRFQSFLGNIMDLAERARLLPLPGSPETVAKTMQDLGIMAAQNLGPTQHKARETFGSLMIVPRFRIEKLPVRRVKKWEFRFFITYCRREPSVAWSRRTHWCVVVRKWFNVRTFFFLTCFLLFLPEASWSTVCPFCWVIQCSDADPASSLFGKICQGRLKSFFRCENIGPSLLRTNSEMKLRALLAAAFSALAHSFFFQRQHWC